MTRDKDDEQRRPQMTEQDIANIVGAIEGAGGTVERIERVRRTDDEDQEG